MGHQIAQPMPMTLWSSMHQADPPACELPFLIAPLACFAACFEEAGLPTPLIWKSIAGGYSSPLSPLMAMTYRAESNPCARNASMDGCVNSATGP